MYIIGLNHKTAPIDIREQYYLNPLEQDLLLSELKAHPAIAEAFVLSTCNRSEVYMKRVDASTSMDFVIPLITKIKKLRIQESHLSHFYRYSGEAALEHLMRVATGLDSLVLGEKQILGQVKHAVERSRQLGMLSKYFNILTNLAIRAGKKAQSETQISCGGSSVSWAAINIAEETLGTLKGKSVLVIGAGKMGELALTQLQNKGIKKIFLMNRTGQKAEALAQKFFGIPVSFMEIKDTLCEVDICICSVGAPHYILDKVIVEHVMAGRGFRKLLFVDISMPRNIDPLAGDVQGVTLLTIDDLDKVVGENMKRRQAEVELVEAIIRQKISDFHAKWDRLKNRSDSDFFEPIEF